MMSGWYTGKQALALSVGFIALDLAVNIFGLAWNGRGFSIDNIKHWMDLANYTFTVNPVDFLGVALLRDCVLLGGAVAVWASPNGAPSACQLASNGVFAVMLLILAFAPSKLLAFYEDDQLKLAIGDWILMIWCVFSSLFVQMMWTNVISRVRERASDDDYTMFGDEQRLMEQEAEEAAKQRESFTLLLRLFGYMAREWRYYGVAFIMLFLYSLSRVFIPYYTGEVVSAVFGAQAGYEKLHNTVLYMAILSASSAFFGALRGGTFTYSQARIDRNIRSDLFRSIVRQEIGFFDANKTGEVCSRISADCQTMSNTLSLYMNVLTRNVTMLIGSIIFMFTLSWRLTMVTFIAIPIIFLLSKVFGVYYDKLSEEMLETTAQANDVAEEVISAVRTMKSFACEKFESRRFLMYLNKTLIIATKKAFAVMGYIWSNEILQMLILTVVLWYGGHLVIKGKIESGLLVSFLLYQFQLGENLRELGEVWNGLMQAVGASRKVFEFVDREPKVKNNGDRAPEGNLRGAIEFKDVHFSYPIRPDLPIMKGVSFTVNPGEVVALVGPSGGGKSSCIALLEHFYEPTSGEVLLDGVPINEYDHGFLHTKVALVGQEPVLYARSVTENIGYGMKHYTDEIVQRSAKLANAHGFIMDTSEGYMTDVGEKGSQMSGGQKQRIAIARALARDPVVLLLDEATSALDSESEHSVQEAISKNLKGRTVILIAHRLSTVENADKIIVISHGVVEQQGTHKELIAQEGTYKQLVERQMMGGDSDARPSAPPIETTRPRRVVSPTASNTQSFIGSFAGGSSYL